MDAASKDSLHAAMIQMAWGLAHCGRKAPGMLAAYATTGYRFIRPIQCYQSANILTIQHMPAGSKVPLAAGNHCKESIMPNTSLLSIWL